VQTPVADGAGAVLDAIGGLIDQLRREAHGRAVVKAIGLIPLGLVDPTAGIALYSANAGWQNLPIRDLISARSGLRVAIDHDVRAAGLAEARLGAAQGVSEAVFVSIGTGIAAAVISSGAVVSGARGLSGEIGHVPVVPDGERCACGQRGCTETYASAAALARRYRAAGGATSLPAEGVIAAASAGDPIAQSVYDEAIAALARALVGYILVMDPSLIVLGGGLANAGELLLGPLGDLGRSGLPDSA
jgi:glucokinase